MAIAVASSPAAAAAAAAASVHGTANHGLYAKLSLVGEGSFGKIWLVRHSKTGGRHVLKEVMLAGLSPKEVEATRLEVEVMKRLDSPHIISFVSSYEEQGVVGILMEHAAGGDLQKEIDKRLIDGRKVPFPEYTIRDYARQLVSAVSYIHKTLMLLHRDLKPANVFLSARNEVKLGDFGFCKLVNVRRINLWPQKNPDGSPPEPRPEPPPPKSKVKGYKPRPYDHAVGTPLYMSPEHIGGSPYDQSADAWACACVIFEAAGLEPPWAELLDGFGGLDGGMEGLYQHVTTAQLGVEPLKANYSEAFCSLIGRLLLRDRGLRIKMDDFLTQLSRLRPVPPPPPIEVTDAEEAAAAEAKAAKEAASKSAAQEAAKAAEAEVAALRALVESVELSVEESAEVSVEASTEVIPELSAEVSAEASTEVSAEAADDHGRDDVADGLMDPVAPAHTVHDAAAPETALERAEVVGLLEAAAPDTLVQRSSLSLE